MERGLAEVILGFRRDPLVGPTVTVGLGGVLAEIYKDAATRLAPVDETEARQMIPRSRAWRSCAASPQPAARRRGCACAGGRSILVARPRQSLPTSPTPRSIRCWSAAGRGVVAVDGLVMLRA